ncbi:MAG: glycosyl transferase group 1 [Acidimicrobiaceae bacterium]|nr:glycosyl transferase group 1 [Acidimicrobiaceae bacterium]
MTVANLPSVEDITVAGRLADVLAAVELRDRPLPLTRRDRALPARLRIVYLVARVGLSAGERVLLAQARHLAALGADVTVLSRAHPDDPDPEHRERRVGTRARLRRVPYGEVITDAVPPCDLIVAGSWEFVLPARMLGFAPVVLFERGELQVLGDVPDHIRSLVAASLRAASVTFALGSVVKDSLATEYGIEARDAPGVVDLGVFRHARGRRGPEARRGGIIVTGFDVIDADGSDHLAQARHIVASLAASDPDLPITLVGALREGAPPFAVSVEAGSEEERARLLRQARLHLSIAGRAAFDLAPLEAMAAGTPVVSTAHLGVLSYAVHGHNAFLVPVDDVDALVAGARRVLSDDVLAARIADGGLTTAAANSWPVVGPQLLAQYEDVAGTSPLAPLMGGFEVTLGGLRFVRQGDAARLRARLGACTTREVALPVSQPAFGDYRAVRWRVVARRSEGDAGSTRVYLPARSERLLDDAPHQASLDLLRSGRAEEALSGFVAACQQSSRAEQAVLGRWVVLAMIAAGRPVDAAEMAGAFARDFPTQPDYVLLAVRSALASHRPLEIAGPLERIRLLGVGARFDEWFEDPHSLLAEDLAGRA